MRIGTRVLRFVTRLSRILVYELGRTQRVVIGPEPRVTTDEPIFITGVHRSGTTLVRLIIDSHTRIACPPESFFLLSATRLLHDEKGLEGLRAMGFPEQQVVAKLREMISSFFELYAASHDKTRWADKTPSYVTCLEDIERLFPAARYVMVYRHGLDVASSIAGIPAIEDADEHIRSCGGDRYAGSARYWAVQCARMREFTQRHTERCLELRYEELVANPENETRRLFSFLGEDWEPGVLRFHEKPHDSWGGLEDRGAMRSRSFDGNVGRHASQPREVIDSMVEQAGPMLRELGYDEVR